MQQDLNSVTQQQQSKQDYWKWQSNNSSNELQLPGVQGGRNNHVAAVQQQQQQNLVASAASNGGPPSAYVTKTLMNNHMSYFNQYNQTLGLEQTAFHVSYINHICINVHYIQYCAEY